MFKILIYLFINRIYTVEKEKNKFIFKILNADAINYNILIILLNP